MRCQRCGYETGGSICTLCGALLGSEGNLIGENRKSRLKQGASRFGGVTEPIRWVFNTLYGSLAKPDTFFAPLRTRAFPKEALLYGLVIGSIATVLMFIANSFFPPFYYAFLSKGSHSTATGMTPVMLMMTPLILIMQFLIVAGFTQLMLLITRSRKKLFPHTFCVICYAAGAAIFEWIPVIGPLAAFVAWFYLTLSGLHTVHGITRVRAFVILILPIVLLFLLFIFIGLIAVLIILAVGGSHTDLLHNLRP